MKKITIVYDHSPYTFKWLKPLFWAQPELKKFGYQIEFSSILDNIPIACKWQIKGIEFIRSILSTLTKKDIVFLAFHHSTSWLGISNSEERIAIVKKFKSKCNKLCWLDTADSTGTGLFDVLPYVDIYFKKQILKEKDLYTKKLYGARLFCDYYHNMLNIEDNQILRKYPVAQHEYLDKIKLSWNVGFADLFAESRYNLIKNKEKMGKPLFEKIDENKIMDIHYRGSAYSPIAGYQRKKYSELIQSSHISHPDCTKQVPHDEYVLEMRRSKAILSPFGWGEICTRDFESFVYGATLLKPSMEHCITWPNVYQANKTYVPMKWDFSDFDEIMSKIGSKEYTEIAQNGQQYYKSIRFSTNAKKMFAEHLVEELER